jgi:hypothetical protein
MHWSGCPIVTEKWCNLHGIGSAVVCAGADALRGVVEGSARPRFAYYGAIAGWTLGNFCISLFERLDVQAHHPGRSLAVGLLIVPSHSLNS